MTTSWSPAALGEMMTAHESGDFAASSQYAAEIAEQDLQADAVRRLVEVGIDQGKARAAVDHLVEAVGLARIGLYIRALCQLARHGKLAAIELRASLCSREPAADLRVTMDQGDTYSLSCISPDAVRRQAAIGFNNLDMPQISSAEVLRATNRYLPGRRDGKRAQRNMLKPWAQRRKRR